MPGEPAAQLLSGDTDQDDVFGTGAEEPNCAAGASGDPTWHPTKRHHGESVSLPFGETGGGWQPRPALVDPAEASAGHDSFTSPPPSAADQQQVRFAPHAKESQGGPDPAAAAAVGAASLSPPPGATYGGHFASPPFTSGSGRGGAERHTRADRWQGFIGGRDALQPVPTSLSAAALASRTACVVPLQNGQLKVHFPYDPQPPQRIVMEAVAQALIEARPALLESPTGTGKTLAALCPVLAFQHLMATTADPRAAPRVIVAVRTHDQARAGTCACRHPASSRRHGSRLCTAGTHRRNSLLSR